MNELYFSSCNSANPDAKENTASAFEDVIDANEITGWDGGTIYKYNDEEPEKSEELTGGYGSPDKWTYKYSFDTGLVIYPTSCKGQSTWQICTPKDEYRWPTREKQGKVRIK